MQDTQENRFEVQDARMRQALRNRDARVYSSLCDELGIPSEARDPHLYAEGRRSSGAPLSNRSCSYVSVKSSGLDVSSCVLSQAAIDYLKSLGDKGLEREDYMARFRQIVRLGSTIPSSLRPQVGASEQEWSILYFALADKARRTESNFPEL